MKKIFTAILFSALAAISAAIANENANLKYVASLMDFAKKLESRNAEGDLSNALSIYARAADKYASFTLNSADRRVCADIENPPKYFLRLKIMAFYFFIADYYGKSDGVALRRSFCDMKNTPSGVEDLFYFYSLPSERWDEPLLKKYRPDSMKALETSARCGSFFGQNELARRFLKNKNYAEAFNILEEANASAQKKIADLEKIQGEDFGLWKYYLETANAHYADILNSLGVCHYYGYGCEKDPEKAAVLLKKSAQLSKAARDENSKPQFNFEPLPIEFFGGKNFDIPQFGEAQIIALEEKISEYYSSPDFEKNYRGAILNGALLKIFRMRADALLEKIKSHSGTCPQSYAALSKYHLANAVFPAKSPRKKSIEAAKESLGKYADAENFYYISFASSLDPKEPFDNGHRNPANKDDMVFYRKEAARMGGFFAQASLGSDYMNLRNGHFEYSPEKAFALWSDFVKTAAPKRFAYWRECEENNLPWLCGDEKLAYIKVLNNLAILRHEGVGGPQNKDEDCAKYLLAALEIYKNLDAEIRKSDYNTYELVYNLCSIYIFGIGVDKDENKAREILKKYLPEDDAEQIINGLKSGLKFRYAIPPEFENFNHDKKFK